MAKKKKKKKKNSQNFAQTEPLINKADKLLDQKRYSEAESCLLTVLKKQPSRKKILVNLVFTYQELNRYDAALSIINNAIEFYPEDYSLKVSKSAILIRMSRFTDAVEILESIKADNSTDPTLLFYLGFSLKKLGKLDESLKVFTECQSAGYDWLKAEVEKADTFKIKGDFETYRKMLRDIILKRPNSLDGYLHYYHLTKPEALNDDFSRIEMMVKNEENDLSLKIAARYCLGNMYHHIGEYDKAFQNYKYANETQKGILPEFDMDNYAEIMDEVTQLVSKDFLGLRKTWGNESKVPVFIVGMPRSGTTLVEQILSSHSRIYGAGELTYISDVYSKEFASDSPEDVSRLIASTEDKQFRHYADQYIKKLSKLSSDSKYVLDKMPGNFQFLWLISIMFPNAKVVHCVRDAVDNCLSCFFQNFETQHAYKLELSTLGRYYRFYQKLMAFWKETIPNEIYDIKYESVVNSTEDTAKGLVAFLDLDWEDSCLKFYDNPRNVFTNVIQVREKVYSSAMNKKANYGPYISELLDSLSGT